MAEVVEAASGKFAAVAEEIGFFRPLHHMKPDIIFGFGDIRKLSVVGESTTGEKEKIRVVPGDGGVGLLAGKGAAAV